MIRSAEVYKRAAIRASLPHEVVSSVAEVVFKELMERMQVPKHLAYELDHVGTFAIRHKNFLNKYRYRVDKYSDDPLVRDFGAVPQLIESFREKKQQDKKRKDEYKQGQGKS